MTWINVAPLRMDQQRGRPVLVEFWDCCRPNSIRTLPYVKAWHDRYRSDGLRVISVHSPGLDPSRDPDVVRAATARLGIEHPVCLDDELFVWTAYGNAGWPARYLWDADGLLNEFHYGEGAYVETELAIQELLGVTREPLAPIHPEDAPDADIVAQTPDRPGAWSGEYEAGAVWAVLSGHGELGVNGAPVGVEYTGAHLLIEHAASTRARLQLAVGAGVTCHAVCFSPGLAPDSV